MLGFGCPQESFGPFRGSLGGFPGFQQPLELLSPGKSRGKSPWVVPRVPCGIIPRVPCGIIPRVLCWIIPCFPCGIIPCAPCGIIPCVSRLGILPAFPIFQLFSPSDSSSFLPGSPVPQAGKLPGSLPALRGENIPWKGQGNPCFPRSMESCLGSSWTRAIPQWNRDFSSLFWILLLHKFIPDMTKESLFPAYFFLG